MTYSYSDLATAQRCLKLYEYRTVRQLQRRARSVELTQGIIVHRLLMAAYRGTLDEERRALQEEVQLYTLDDEVITAEELLTDSERLVQRYLDHYDDDWEILHVEETFEAEWYFPPGTSVNIPRPISLSFTPDLVVRTDEGVWIVDHKTTSQMPATVEVPVGDFQAFLYSSIITQVYPDFVGFIFNKIRKKLPRQPRLTKTGPKRVADLQRLDTDYETLRDFLMAEAPDLLDDEAHRRRLAELRDTNRFFWRREVYVTPEIALQTLRDVQHTVASIELAHELNHFPRHFLPYAGARSCERCPFSELCVAELRGYDTEAVLYLYEEREPRDTVYAELDGGNDD